MARQFRYSRPKTAPPQSLRAYLAQKFAYFTPEEWDHQINMGFLSVQNMVVRDPNQILRQQDVITYSPPSSREPPVDFQHLDFLFEDDSLLLCCKNGCIPVTEGDNEKKRIKTEQCCAYSLEDQLDLRKEVDFGPFFCTSDADLFCISSRECLEESPEKTINNNFSSEIEYASAGKKSKERSCAESTHVHYYPVHRLDKETSGVLVFAKSLSVAQKLSSMMEDQSRFLTEKVEQQVSEAKTMKSSLLSCETFQSLLFSSYKTIEKSYVAVLSGAPDKGRVFLVVNRIGALVQNPSWRSREEHTKLAKLKMLCYPLDETVVDGEKVMLGKIAVSRITIVASSKEIGCCVARIDLLTGRTHQIRLHCAHVGYPILGDKLYTTASPGVEGGEYPVPDALYLDRVRGPSDSFLPDAIVPLFQCRRHLLHATKLSFPHPCRSNTIMRSSANPLQWFLMDVSSEKEGAVNALEMMLQIAYGSFF